MYEFHVFFCAIRFVTSLCVFVIDLIAYNTCYDNVL